jgi:hypothetical protein
MEDLPYPPGACLAPLSRLRRFKLSQVQGRRLLNPQSLIPEESTMSLIERTNDGGPESVRRARKGSATEASPRVYPEVRIDGRITAQRVRLTPKLAQAFLDTRSSGQRPIKAYHIRMLDNQLNNGCMMLNGETIVFDSNGCMVNGQHRCQAVVNTGVSFDVIVIRGVDPASVKTFDGGSRRSARDYLKGRGYPNAGDLATAVGMLYRYEHGDAFDYTIAISNPLIDEVLNRHEGLSDSISFNYGCRALCFGMANAGFAHYLFRGRDAKAADTMFRSLASGQDLKASSPILTLREHLIRMRRIESRVDYRRKEVVTCLVLTWNAIRERKPLRSMRFDSRDKLPTIA